MSDIFKVKLSQRLPRDKYKLNLVVPKYNQVTSGAKNLKIYGPKMGISLPYHLKTQQMWMFQNYKQKLVWSFFVVVQNALINI